MSAGDLEVMKAIEDITANNAKTVVAFCQETRKMVQGLKKEVENLQNVIATKDVKLAELTKQLSLIQARLYSGGTQ